MVLPDQLLINTAKFAEKNLHCEFTIVTATILATVKLTHHIALQLSMFIHSAISGIQEHAGKNRTSN